MKFWQSFSQTLPTTFLNIMEISSLKIDQINLKRVLERYEAFVKMKADNDITADDLEVAELVSCN